MTVIAPTPAARRAAARPAPVARTVDRRSMDGQVLGQVTLHPETFGIVPNVAVLHQVVTAQLAAARAGTQSTRTRAEVSGGGAKPFRQKGTGRARQGSTRAPQWTGGGVALGPKPRSYRQRTPKKMVRLALRSALSDRAALGKVALVDQWSFEVPRTKDAVAALTALGLDGRVLVVLGPDDWAAERSFANLPRIQVLAVGELNAYDVLRNDWVVFTDATLPGGEGAADPSSGSEIRPVADGATAVAATDAATTDGVPAGEAADEAEVADDAAASADAGADDPASAGDTAEEEQA